MARRAAGRRFGDERGSASLELVGVLPFLLVAVLVAAQLAIAGAALWSASIAARRNARVALLRGDHGIASGVADVPRLLPGMPPLKVVVRTRLDGG